MPGARSPERLFAEQRPHLGAVASQLPTDARHWDNAGGDDLEESAVCFLQVILADFLDGVGRDRLMRDMDAWGYSFRLGSTAAWSAAWAGRS